MGILLRTGAGFYSDRYLNLLRITWRESRRGERREGRNAAAFDFTSGDSAVDSTIRPLLLASVNLSLSIRTRKWRNCASVILFDVRSTRLVERSWIPPGIRSTRKREKPEVERPRVSPRTGNAARHPRGTLARTLDGDRWRFNFNVEKHKSAVESAKEKS